MLAFWLSALLLAGKPASPPVDFWSFWGDGKAELSSYRTVVSRYGELRKGYAVLVFVTEDISRKTRIKVESPDVPKEDRVPVIKLNRVEKFTTGIYDYSLLTSVFSAVESEFGRPPLQPMKISFSAQEWCGHVFAMLKPNQREAEYTLHSYFQREGDRQERLSLPRNAAYEDNLFIWIRELKGEVMPAGASRKLQILPSMWHSRSRHVELKFQPGTIRKEDGGEISIGNNKYAAWKWSWQVAGTSTTVWVEKSYPHRILKWESSDGGRGELINTLRVPYWSLHDNDDLPYRDRLGIPR